MKKRVISLLLASAVAMGALAGCGQAEESTGAKVEEKADASAEQDSAAESNGEAEEEQELVTLKIMTRNMPMGGYESKEFPEFAAGKAFIEDMAERGVALEFEFVEDADWDNVLNTRMASQNDLPDLLVNAFGDMDTTMTEWGRRGLIREVTELLEQYDTDGSIKAFHDKYSPGSWEMSLLGDGTTYWFCEIFGNKPPVDPETGETIQIYNYKNLLIRKDWLEAIGEEYKYFYTPDELFDVLKKMQDQDANGNGKADEVMYVTINNFHNGFAHPFGLNCKTTGGYREGVDVVYNNFEHENFPAYIEFMNKIYEAGLYDTEALSISDTEMIAQNRVALTFNYQGSAFTDVMTDYADYQPIYLDWDADPSNGFDMIQDYYGGSIRYGMVIPGKTSEDKVEAAMKFIDYIYSDEYLYLSNYGVEGLGYEVDQNGVVVSLRDQENKDTWSLANWCNTWVFPSLYVCPNIYNVKVDEDERVNARNAFALEISQYFEMNLAAGNVVPIGTQYAQASDEESALIDEVSGTLSTYCSELVVDLILGRKSLDDLDTYIEEMNELGMQDYLAVMQARRDRVTGK